jgi:hypothetical protein
MLIILLPEFMVCCPVVKEPTHPASLLYYKSQINLCDLLFSVNRYKLAIAFVGG